MESASYENIMLNLGVDHAEEVLFATDSVGEAEAAREAGWQVALVVRPGNAQLPADHGVRVVTSMHDLLV